MNKLIRRIEEYENHYPKDVFSWDSKEKVDITRGRFHEFCFSIVENVREDMIKIVKEGMENETN